MNSRFEAGLRKKKFVSLPFFLCDKAGNSGGIPFCIKNKTEENEHERPNQEQTD